MIYDFKEIIFIWLRSCMGVLLWEVDSRSFARLKEILLVSTIVRPLLYETNKIIETKHYSWLLPVAFIAKYQKWVGRISKRVFVISGRDTVMTRTHLRLLLYLNQPLSSHHTAKGLYNTLCKKANLSTTDFWHFHHSLDKRLPSPRLVFYDDNGTPLVTDQQ